MDKLKLLNASPIYLDYAASTPVDPRVAQKMFQCLTAEDSFGNSGALHSFGECAKQAIENAREKIAAVLHAAPRQIIFTSGATEANNLAIKGVAQFYQNRGKHIITSQTEHKSVLESCANLEEQGFSVTYLKPNNQGIIELETLKAAILPETILVSIMHVNNETGVIQNIAAIGALTRSLGIFLHVDAVQSFGKCSIDVQVLQIDLLSLSAHKVYGPKGIGALYIGDNPRVRLIPLIQGGGQERKFRAGTLPTHQIVGIGETFAIAHQEMQSNIDKITRLRDQFWQGIKDLPGVYLNTEIGFCVPNILNIRFESIQKELFLQAVKNLAISSASACNSITIEPSHVLRAMGFSDETASRSFRFSFGRVTTPQEIEFAIYCIQEALKGEKR